MASLFNQQISATYQGLLKTTSNGIITSSLAQITDGSGNGSPLSISTTEIQFNTGSNTFKFPTTRGASGQILKLADANGTLDWVADSAASTLNFSGSTSGTGSIALNTQTLAFLGTANQITAIAGSQAITFAFPSGGVILPNGSVATTQSASDNSTKIATTAYVTTAVASSGSGNVTCSGTTVTNRVAVWNNTTKDLKTTSSIYNENSNILLVQPSANGTDKFNYIIGGAFAINENDFGTQNTGFGHAVLNGADLTGGSNASFGMQSQTALTTGSHNTSIGSFAMYDNRSGDYNVGLGAKTMFNQRISNNNVSIGYDSMDGVTASQTAASNNNVAIGYESLHIIEGGDNNTVLGYQSGSAITTGSKNVIIGSNTGSTIAASNNNIILSDGDGNNRIQVDSVGNVGIGTLSPSGYLGDGSGMGIYGGTTRTTLSIISDTFSSLYFSKGDGTSGNAGANAYQGYIDYQHSNNSLQFGTSQGERMRIAAGGDVGIGTSPANGKLEIKTANAIAYTPTSYIDNTSIRLVTGGAAAEDKTTGISMAVGGDAEAYIGVVQNSGGKGDIVFQSHITGGTYSEKMRITSKGTLLNTANSNNGSNAIFKNNSSTTPYGISVELPNGSSDDTRYLFYGGLASNAPRFKVSTSGKIYAVNTTVQSISDIRFKENIRDLDTGLSEILQLKPRLFDWKKGKGMDTKDSVGFIAQEIEEILPKLVDDNWSEDGLDEKGAVIEGVKYKTVGQGGLIPTLVKAIQEQQTIIADLKTRIEKLEL